MRKERDEFLRDSWQSYPTVSDEFCISGRLVSIDKVQKGLCVQIANENQVLQTCCYYFSELFFSSKSFWLDILIEGDWIAIKVDQSIREKKPLIEDILLVAPCMLGNEDRLKYENKSISSSASIQLTWNLFKKQIRNFFLRQRFIEIETPSLVTCPGTEPFLDVFEVPLDKSPMAKSKKTLNSLYLPTSPELHLKKALGNGYTKIFEIKNCFRQGEFSEKHQPEFTMLEWYRTFKNLDEIKTDCENLISFLSGKKIRIQQKSMAEIFDEICHFRLNPGTTIEELKGLAIQLGIHSSVLGYEIWDDVFFQIYVEKIEPVIEEWSFQAPLFIKDYPPSQAALARLTPQGWGDRFELYWMGMELANAFHELNDPKIQRERSQEDLALKTRLGKKTFQMDEDFLMSLDRGMPPSAGIACGVERLFLSLVRDLQNNLRGATDNYSPGDDARLNPEFREWMTEDFLSEVISNNLFIKIQDLKLFPYQSHFEGDF